MGQVVGGSRWSPRGWISAAVLALVVAGAIAGGAAGAAPSPSGWWKGTFTVTEQWDAKYFVDSRKGQAKLTIVRTGPATAQYSIEYLNEVRSLDGACASFVERATWSGVGPLDVRDPKPETVGAGMSLRLRDPATKKAIAFPVLREDQSCDGTVTRTRTDPRSVVYVGFSTPGKVAFKNAARGQQVIEAPSAQAKTAYAGYVGLFFNKDISSGKGVTKITWDLQLVGGSTAPSSSGSALRVGKVMIGRTVVGKVGYLNVVVPLSLGGRGVRLTIAPLCHGKILGDPTSDRGYDGLVVPSRAVPAVLPKLGIPGGSKLTGSSAVLCRFGYTPAKDKGKVFQGSVEIFSGKRGYPRPFRVTL